MNNNQNLVDRTLALAGLAQSAHLVQGLARSGKIDQHYLELAVHSLFTFDAQNVAEIYGDVASLSLGLETIQSHFFKPKSPVDAEIMRYSIQLFELAKKLNHSSKISEQVASQLMVIDKQIDLDVEPVDGDLIERIASVYLDNISGLKPRVIVSGEQGYLAQKETAAKVRVCLLCGLRSAFLWLQKGGSKLQMITARRQYQDKAGQLLAQMV